MAASSLRFAQLTARKNQVEFEGQQINQQRLVLSQKSSAIYNDMLTKQVPTAPDPSQFTKIVYKFNNGFGNSTILNLAKKTSGPYNYNVTYKRPKTTKTRSKTSLSNVGFSTHIGVTDTSVAGTTKYYARVANINGISRNLSLVGDNGVAAKLDNYRSKLETYKNMKTIEEQISSLSGKKPTDTVSSSTQQSIKSALGLDLKDNKPNNTIETALFGDISKPSDALRIEKPDSYHTGYKTNPTTSVTGVALSSSYPTTSATPTATELQKQAAYNMAVALGLTQGSGVTTLSGTLTQNNMTGALNAILTENNSPMSTHLRKKLTGTDAGTALAASYNFGEDNVVSQDDIYKSGASPSGAFSGLNELERKELANLLAQYANGSTTALTDAQKVTDDEHAQYAAYTEYNGSNPTAKAVWDNYTSYGQAANSLYNVANGGAADSTVTNEQMIKMLQEMLKKISDTNGTQYSSSGDYKAGQVDPAFTQYQSSVATPGIQNVGEGQILYTYQDDDGENCYMYVSIDNILDDGSSTYADTVSVYENSLSYLEDEYETEQQDANVIMSDEGQVAKITFADGTVVTPEVVTEMDDAAYNQAMVEYEYKKDVYDKEMNDANAKVKIIQAQDQKLEVRLKQLDTEQKALQTEIDAVKSVRDKAIENSFKTFS